MFELQKPEIEPLFPGEYELMSRRKSNPTPKHKQIRRERDPLPWKYCFLTVVCGLILLAGFFGAARQHFASIEYSIKNSKLKKQIEELESEKRSLINSRETALAPTEIIKAAKKYGFAKIENALEILPSETEKSKPEKVSVRKLADDETAKDSKTKSDTKDEKKTVEKSKTKDTKKDEKPAKDTDNRNKKGTAK